MTIRWPKPQEMELSSRTLRNYEQGILPKDAFGVVGGESIPCAYYEEKDLQNAYSEVWTTFGGN